MPGCASLSWCGREPAPGEPAHGRSSTCLLHIQGKQIFCRASKDSDFNVVEHLLLPLPDVPSTGCATFWGFGQRALNCSQCFDTLREIVVVHFSRARREQGHQRGTRLHPAIVAQPLRLFVYHRLGRTVKDLGLPMCQGRAGTCRRQRLPAERTSSSCQESSHAQ